VLFSTNCAWTALSLMYVWGCCFGVTTERIVLLIDRLPRSYLHCLRLGSHDLLVLHSFMSYSNITHLGIIPFTQFVILVTRLYQF
jgi:hypothetical protein